MVEEVLDREAAGGDGEVGLAMAPVEAPCALPAWLKPAAIDFDLPEDDGEDAAEPESVSWVAVFHSWCLGIAPRELASLYGVPIRAIQRRVKAENWPQLCETLPAEEKLPAGVLATRQRLVWENRERNQALASKFRDGLAKVIEKFQRGNLKVEVVKANKDGVQVIETDAGPREIQQLASALKQVTDVTYRAVGDLTEHERKDGPNAHGQPAVNIIIPNVVMRDDEPRQVDGFDRDVPEEEQLPPETHSPIPDVLDYERHLAAATDDEDENPVPG